MVINIELPNWKLEWNEELSVYIPEIDAEHQRFIGLVNDLNEAVATRMNVEEIKKRMQAIVDDALAHFSHEETLFREWGYPLAAEHAEKHAEVREAMGRIMGDFEQGGTEYEWIEAGLRVKQALIDHLLTEDMKYRDYRLSLLSQAASGAGESPPGASY